MSGRFLFLKNTVGTPKAIAELPNGHRITILEQPEFTADALNGMSGLLLGQHRDEAHLETFRFWLDAFITQGRAVATMGPVAIPYLTMLQPHLSVGQGHKSDWLLDMADAHPITEGVVAENLTFRKGVVGFWARGTIAPPEGARTLSRFSSNGAPADWVWEGARGGKLFVHPGNDVWGYAGEPNSSARVFPQLLDWMTA